MADSHPFANAGLGMFGGAEKQYSQQAMSADGKSGPLSKLLGEGLDWLADQMSNKTPPQGSVPVPQNSNNVVSPQPIPPVNYGFSGSLNMPQANAPVVPYSQATPLSTETTTPTENNQFTVGGYRKFLRPQGFGTPQQ
jgi:hypothetical protein